MNPMVPGTYVNLEKVDDQDREVTIQINLRIPLSAFLTLFNLRFYPNWAGKLSIEIYPSYKNLVIAPVHPKEAINDALGRYRIDEDYDPPNTIEDKTALNHINFGFRNVNQTMVNQIGENSKTSTEYIAEQTFTCNGDGCYTDKCKIRLATYLLKMDIFNALAAKYIQVPLLYKPYK